MISRSLYFVLPALLLLSSCSKETTVSDTQELIGTWEVAGIESNIPFDWDNDGFEETDIFGTYNFCQQDILMTFEPGGYGQTRQGCNAPVETLNWEMANNYLDIYMNSDDLHLYVTYFDGYTLRGYDQVQVFGDTYHITYTLNKRW